MRPFVFLNTFILSQVNGMTSQLFKTTRGINVGGVKVFLGYGAPDLNTDVPSGPEVYGAFYVDGLGGLIWFNTNGTWAPISGAGATGTTWLRGVGAPSNALGANDYFYLDTATGSVYYKASGAWVQSLIGASAQSIYGYGGGSIWIKRVQRGPGEPSTTDVIYKTKNTIGAITEIAGNSEIIRLTVAAMPGANGRGTNITGYSVPGAFTPSAETPYPAPVTSPVSAAVFTQLRVNDEENTLNDPAMEQLDHMEFHVDIPVTFQDGVAQIVLTTDAGGFIVVPYTEEKIARLISADIQTLYTDIAPYRTGFTAGDTVDLTFTADAPVHSIYVWQFDAISDSMNYEPTEYVVSPAATSGTVSIQITVTDDYQNTAYGTGGLIVSASRYSQPTASITTTSSFTFDQRTPDFDVLLVTNYNYPGTQTAIKGSEQVTVEIDSFVDADEFSVTVNGANIQLVTTNPHPILAGVGSATFERTGTDYTGQGTASITAMNYNNGKTKVSTGNYITLDVEGSTYNGPSISVSGSPIISRIGDPEPSTITITSDVKIKNPTGVITLPGLTTTAFTSGTGYVWVAEGYATDASPRGTQTVTSGSLTTGAGTPITVDGDYAISGFDARPITITTPFADSIDVTSSVSIDYPSGLSVVDIAFQPVAYTVLGNVITFTNPDFYESNASGTLFVYIEQTPNPGL